MITGGSISGELSRMMILMMMMILVDDDPDDDGDTDDDDYDDVWLMSGESSKTSWSNVGG